MPPFKYTECWCVTDPDGTPRLVSFAHTPTLAIEKFMQSLSGGFFTWDGRYAAGFRVQHVYVDRLKVPPIG